jgi:hypothetical protein
MDLTELRDSRDDLARLGERWLLIADVVGMAAGAGIAFAALFAFLG